MFVFIGNQKEVVMRKLLHIVVVGIAALGIGIRPAMASEIDMLLEKLVDKGVLTAGESQIIKTETEEQVKKEIAQGKSSTLPLWIQNTKLKGDFRVRYQYDHTKTLPTADTKDRERARIRVRLGIESKVNDQLLVAVGLSTGTNNSAVASYDASRSPNQSLGEGWAKKVVDWNYAYAQYTPVSWATLVAGKMNNPLWEPGDLIWDTDINPEGGALKLSKTIIDGTDGFFNTGAFVLGEAAGNAADPMMFVAQAGVKQKINDNVSVKSSVSFYDSTGMKNKLLEGSVGTNTGLTAGSTVTGTLKNNYRDITPAVEVTFKDSLKAIGVDLPYLAVFGEYVANIDSTVKTKKTGFMYGLKFGDEKVEKWRDWQVRYNYAMLGRDAVLDILPDSDRYGGKTGIRAHELMLDFGLSKNTFLGFDYYNAWQIPGNFGQTQSKPTQVVQCDWNMKF